MARMINSIVNRDIIGKATDDLLERWNQEHPDDSVTCHLRDFVTSRPKLEFLQVKGIVCKFLSTSV
jgi:hypothetical protein